ncbi:hypothetical protein HMPREF1316_2254 [Olsenella profusa F0195]|uniref:Uncharacterized protein n=1 Tax=Olsenella profusa F0195 TaxID=1125712 RepID=U2TMK1_9ACTN|nr:hypothetical protein HMPREF1316_2254 [Olsenella profusa F0195]
MWLACIDDGGVTSCVPLTQRRNHYQKYSKLVRSCTIYAAKGGV